MKKYKLFLIIFISIVIITTILLSNPLRKSNDSIRKDVINITPLGTEMDEVIRVINNKKWSLDWISEYSYKTHQLSSYQNSTDDGKKTIRACIGEYRNIFVSSVVVWWEFDNNNELIEIYVEKHMDSM